MIKVSIADTENVGVEEYFADQAMVVLYDANGEPDIVYQSQLSDDAKTTLILKTKRYARALIETLEAW